MGALLAVAFGRWLFDAAQSMPGGECAAAGDAGRRFLGAGSPGPNAPLAAAFVQGLRESGFSEGSNVAVEYRWGESQSARLPELAADLVRRKVAVIAATGGESTVRAAMAVTSTIPIVFQSGGDPVGGASCQAWPGRPATSRA